MSWDSKAERIAARAEADRARAEADAIRMRAEMERQRAQAELDREQDDRRRQRARERRQAVVEAVRRRGHWAVVGAAVGAPALFAWDGQYTFAHDTLQAGWMSPLMPIATEGGVLYNAYMAHRAVSEDVPATRYRLATVLWAAAAAGMNFWHGRTTEIGVTLGLLSLASIVLLELSVHLSKSVKDKTARGRDMAAVRRALIRRLRYPVLSMQAAALAAARGISSEEAWKAAWVDRYGVGPEASRHERRIARAVMRREERAARKAARRGGLTVVDGKVVPTEGSSERSGERPSAEQVGAEDERSRPLSQEPDDVREAIVHEAGRDLARAVERYLASRVETPGALLDLPDDGPHELSAAERMARGVDGGGVQSKTESVTAHDTAHGIDAERSGEHSGERSDERPVVAHGGSDERSDERSRKRSRRGIGRRSRKRRERSQDGHAQRLETVRRLLAENPDMSGADIQAATGIPESTARRLRAQIRAERERDGEAG